MKLSTQNKENEKETKRIQLHCTKRSNVFFEKNLGSEGFHGGEQSHPFKSKGVTNSTGLKKLTDRFGRDGGENF